MPPDSVKTPSSLYWRTLSAVSWVISLEWSTGKMKFDAWPVDPPGFGNGPLSICTRSVQPSLARWYAMLLPTMPAPMMTAFAFAGSVLMVGAIPSLVPKLGESVVGYSDRRMSPSNPSTWVVMTAGSAISVTVSDRLEQRAVLEHGIGQARHSFQGEEPDAEGVHVVLVEHRLEESVVRGRVDETVDSLVELDQLATLGDRGGVVELGEQAPRACDGRRR